MCKACPGAEAQRQDSSASYWRVSGLFLLHQFGISVQISTGHVSPFCCSGCWIPFPFYYWLHDWVVYSVLCFFLFLTGSGSCLTVDFKWYCKPCSAKYCLNLQWLRRQDAVGMIPNRYPVGQLSIRGSGPFPHPSESSLWWRVLKSLLFDICLAAGNWENVCILEMCWPSIKMLIFIRRQENAWRAWELWVLKGGGLFCWREIQENFLLLFSVAWKVGLRL